MRRLATRRVATRLAAVVVAWLAIAATARAQAPPDTTLEQYLGRMSDSTDAWFGRIAEPLDTTGFDSAEAFGRPTSRRLEMELEWGPALDFNRVDAAVYGLGAAVGMPDPLGRLGGRLTWANGPNEWLGGIDYRNHLPIARGWDLRVFGGRITARMNRENDEHTLRRLRAFLSGSDRSHYLRHDGYTVSLEHDEPAWRGGLGWRDVLESPLATTATWNLFNREPKVPWNLAATLGRARELSAELGTFVPATPIQAELRFAHSDGAYGSDFDYGRMRLAAGADLPIGRWASLVPQVAYGRLRGDFTPQAAFYLGGSTVLRGLPGDAVGGASMALGKLDLISTINLLELARIPKAEAFPISPGIFVESGAVWGRDAYGGTGFEGDAWPDDDAAWLSSAGVSLNYSSALLEGQLLRFNWAWPIGPRDGGARFSLAVSRPLDLLRGWGAE